MPDWIDDSQAWQAKLLEAQIIDATRKIQTASAFICQECEDIIPEQRRAIIVGVQRCISCQNLEEKNLRNFRINNN